MTPMRTAKNLVKALGSPLIDSLGVYQRRIDRLIAETGSWTIVMYHRVIVDPAADPFRLGMCVSRDRFAAQVRYFRQHFHPIGLNEGAQMLARGDPLPPRALSVTFDDGYLDNLTHALPVLKTHGMPYALYVPTGGLDSGDMLWWDRVIGAVACTERQAVELAELGLVTQPETLSLAAWQRVNTVSRMLDLLWRLPSQQMRASVERIERALRPRITPQLYAGRLSSSQLRDLHAQGVEIGAHSVDHPNLALATSDETRQELLGSRSELEQLLQAPVPGLAYPGGRMRAETARIAQELGFEYAVATSSGNNQPPIDVFELRRVGMPDTSMSDFRRAVSVTLTGRRQIAKPVF